MNEYDKEFQNIVIREQAQQVLEQGREVQNMLDWYLNPPKFRPGEFRAWARRYILRRR